MAEAAKKFEIAEDNENAAPDADITRFARQAGILMTAPPEGSPAAEKIFTACFEYIQLVDHADQSSSDDARRGAHRELCRVLGYDYDRVDMATRRKVSDFAALIADRKDLVGQF